MADFSTRNLLQGGRTMKAWANLVTDDALYQSIVTSLLLAVLTVVVMLILLVPTMIWVRLRTPWAKGAIEFLCLLPLTIPAAELKYAAIVVCAAATFAAIQEGHFIRTGRHLCIRLNRK
jgi:ABC-type spermidine/putrescine transport system permease subunit II